MTGKQRIFAAKEARILKHAYVSDTVGLRFRILPAESGCLVPGKSRLHQNSREAKIQTRNEVLKSDSTYLIPSHLPLGHITVIMSRPESRTSSSTVPVRPRHTSQSRPPLESLIYTLVPTLAPARSNRYGSTGRAGSSGRSSVAESRRGDEDGEVERREKVKELMHFCDEIMGR